MLGGLLNKPWPQVFCQLFFPPWYMSPFLQSYRAQGYLFGISSASCVDTAVFPVLYMLIQRYLQ